MDVDYKIIHTAVGTCDVCGCAFGLEVSDAMDSDGSCVECDCGNGMKLKKCRVNTNNGHGA